MILVLMLWLVVLCSNGNGQVSAEELSAAIAGSTGLWADADKLAVGASVDLLLRSLHPYLTCLSCALFVLLI